MLKKYSKTWRIFTLIINLDGSKQIYNVDEKDLTSIEGTNKVVVTYGQKQVRSLLMKGVI